MTIDQTGFVTCCHVLNMIAYGCNGKRGFDADAYSLLVIRCRKILPKGETLPEFRPVPSYPILSGDDIDSAAFAAARRLTDTPEPLALALMHPALYSAPGVRRSPAESRAMLQGAGFNQYVADKDRDLAA
jgi:hypothetical protein